MIKAVLTVNYTDGSTKEFQFQSRAKAMSQAMDELRKKGCSSVLLILLARSEEQR